MGRIECEDLFEDVEVLDEVEWRELLGKEKLVGNRDRFLMVSDEERKGKGGLNRGWG
ncbi:hypothetical protein [Staphylococcus saprophyticus]|uniref:hypothetical protein n=1 Tax=Staphylococcus saprophyticus TaxID=29385 RepID=UPI0016424C8D|nr:hypothetical protein [Staphylococcus saprophyticus]